MDYIETFSKQKNTEIYQLKQRIEDLEVENNSLKAGAYKVKDQDSKNGFKKDADVDDLLDSRIEAEIQGDPLLMEYIGGLKSKIKLLESSNKNLSQDKVIYDEMNAQQKELEKIEVHKSFHCSLITIKIHNL